MPRSVFSFHEPPSLGGGGGACDAHTCGVKFTKQLLLISQLGLPCIHTLAAPVSACADGKLPPIILEQCVMCHTNYITSSSCCLIFLHLMKVQNLTLRPKLSILGDGREDSIKIYFKNGLTLIKSIKKCTYIFIVE
jgi:hypothetical protein